MHLCGFASLIVVCGASALHGRKAVDFDDVGALAKDADQIAQLYDSAARSIASINDGRAQLADKKS